MGVSYSAVKTEKPEAYELGKDYFALTDLFPVTAGEHDPGVFGFVSKMAMPKIEDLPFLVGSRHPFVNNTVFKVTDFYQSGDEIVKKAAELKQRQFDEYDQAVLRGFFEWAGDDPLQLICEFDALKSREAEGEYQLCVPPNEYKHMDPHFGEVGREVGWPDEEDEDEE